MAKSKVFVVLVTEGVEPMVVRLFIDKAKSEKLFEAYATTESLVEYNFEELKGELTGTLRMAGDDSYCVQLLEREIE